MIPDNILDEIIKELTDSDVVPVVQLIKGKSHVSEVNIAEKLNMTVNHVRNILYRLGAHSLVDFTRKKDKKKGWYVYYWTLDMAKLRDLAVKIKTDMVAKLKERLVREESGEFFNCPDKHIRLSLENAMEYKFRCPECDLPLEKEENARTIGSIRKQIDRLNREIDLLKSLDIKPIVERKLTRVVKKKGKGEVVPRKKTGKSGKVRKKPKKVKVNKKTHVRKPPKTKIMGKIKKIISISKKKKTKL